MASMCSWHTRDIDFDQPHTQEDISSGAFLCYPAGLRISSRDRNSIELIKNVCGLKKGGYEFHEKLKSKLVIRGFVQSKSDPCAF